MYSVNSEAIIIIVGEKKQTANKVSLPLVVNETQFDLRWYYPYNRSASGWVGAGNARAEVHSLYKPLKSVF